MSNSARDIAATVAQKLTALGLMKEGVLTPDVMRLLTDEVEKELRYSKLRLSPLKSK